jgi:hypothetical protein
MLHVSAYFLAIIRHLLITIQLYISSALFSMSICYIILKTATVRGTVEDSIPSFFPSPKLQTIQLTCPRNMHESRYNFVWSPNLTTSQYVHQINNNKNCPFSWREAGGLYVSCFRKLSRVANLKSFGPRITNHWTPGPHTLSAEDCTCVQHFTCRRSTGATNPTILRFPIS